MKRLVLVFLALIPAESYADPTMEQVFTELAPILSRQIDYSKYASAGAMYYDKAAIAAREARLFQALPGEISRLLEFSFLEKHPQSSSLSQVPQALRARLQALGYRPFQIDAVFTRLQNLVRDPEQRRAIAETATNAVRASRAQPGAAYSATRWSVQFWGYSGNYDGIRVPAQVVGRAIANAMRGRYNEVVASLGASASAARYGVTAVRSAATTGEVIGGATLGEVAALAGPLAFVGIVGYFGVAKPISEGAIQKGVEALAKNSEEKNILWQIANRPTPEETRAKAISDVQIKAALEEGRRLYGADYKLPDYYIQARREEALRITGAR